MNDETRKTSTYLMQYFVDRASVFQYLLRQSYSCNLGRLHLEFLVSPVAKFCGWNNQLTSPEKGKHFSQQ